MAPAPRGDWAPTPGRKSLAHLSDRVGQRIDDRRIELAPRPGRDLLESLIRVHRVPVRAVRGHRGVGVARADDPAPERYARTAQPIGIAAAIPALVVEADHRRHGLEPRDPGQGLRTPR